MAPSAQHTPPHSTSPPGSLIHIGKKKREKISITLFSYNEASFEERKLSSIEELFQLSPDGNVWWVNIDGLHDIHTIQTIGTHFNIHDLILEDILDTNQRPKVEETDTYLSVIVKMLHHNKHNNINTEQVSIIVGADYVISFQEYLGDVFEPIRDRIRHNKGRIRKMGADYLGYSLIDALIDNYYVILEKLGDRIEDLETTVINKPSPATLKLIYNLKREILNIRKSIWPLREIIGNLQRASTRLINEDISPYLKDLYDHIAQVIDTTETFREMVSGLLDIYLSSVSNKMNEVMKVLTIIATIFIPITFIVGLYGMNFKYMPELEWYWGYFAVLLIIVIIVISLIIFFKKKKWL
jgi:magnesium transporter